MPRPFISLHLRTTAGFSVLLVMLVLLAGCPAGSDDDTPSPRSADEPRSSDADDVNDGDDLEATDEAQPGDPEADSGAPAADDDPTQEPPKDLDSPIPPEFEGAITVMAVGDSITMGRSDRPSWRYPFQALAAADDCPIDMVGSEDQWADGTPSGDLKDFDHDHQSVGGRTTLQSAQAVIPLAPAFQPDVVLIHTGTNDLTKGVAAESAESELRRMLQSLAEANPEVLILVAEIIPAGPALADETREWNQHVDDLAEEFDRDGVKVQTVDMFDGWDYQTMTVEEDNIHPNQEGAEFLANRWYQALTKAGVC